MVTCLDADRNLPSAEELLSCSLDDLLRWMRYRGSSVNLGWGEDIDQWECSWITSGRRFTCVSATARGAAYGAARKGIEGP